MRIPEGGPWGQGLLESGISHVVWEADTQLVALTVVVVVVLKELEHEADGHVSAANINIRLPPIL